MVRKKKAIRPTVGDTIFLALDTVLLVLLLVIIAYPLLFVISASFSQGATTMSLSLIPHTARRATPSTDGIPPAAPFITTIPKQLPANGSVPDRWSPPSDAMSSANDPTGGDHFSSGTYSSHTNGPVQTGALS